MEPLTDLSRADFIRGLGAAGAAALLFAPGPASAAGSPATLSDETDSFRARKHRCASRLTLEYRLDDGTQLQNIGAWMKRHNHVSDMYLEGELISWFERDIAERLGKESACWMPTGTMAQLIALRQFAEDLEHRAIGWHPSSHHLLHEENAFSHLHYLESQIISPWERPIQASDVLRAPELAAISIELPVRWIGQVQTWDELAAVKTAAQHRGIPLMMDGARLWETQPYYNKSYAEICDGFSAVHVSFYKMIGGLGGAILASDGEFVERAKIWRHRLGGNLFQNGVYVAAAAMNIDRVLPKLASYRERAIELADLLAQDDRLIVMPDPPQTNLFRVFVPGEPEALISRRDQIAQQTGIWVGDYFRPSRVPGLSQVELQIDDGLKDTELIEAAAAFRRLLS